jgi:hypothetical protein
MFGALAEFFIKISKWWRARPRWQQITFIVVLLLILLRPWIAEWLSPNSSFRDQLTAAEKALERGELSRQDAKGAKELYEAILAVQPDQPDARDGLQQVLNAALTNASLAITKKNYVEAERMIELARNLSASSEQLQPLQISLRTALRSDNGIQQWMRDAAMAAEQGSYFYGDGALASYAKILQIAPDYQPARDEREVLITQILKRQPTLIQQDKLDLAKKELDLIIQADDTHYQLPEATDALSSALEQRNQWIKSKLAASGQAIQKDFTAAGSLYLQVLKRIPEHAVAREGLKNASSGLQQETEKLLADLKLSQVEKNLQTLSGWGVKNPELDRMKMRLSDARSTSQYRDLVIGNPAQLRESMLAAMEQKRWLQPPGESAWDYLRQIRIAEKKSANVSKDEKLFLGKAWDCYESSIKDNLLSDAGHCLEALRFASPNDKRIADATAKLAMLWRSWASDHIARNELQQARYSTAQAARWDKKHPEQQPLEDRLEALSDK